MKDIPKPLRSILDEFSAALKQRHGDRFVGLWLYGSQARGDAHPDSDVDLILRLRHVTQPGREIDKIGDILADMNLRYGVLLSVLPVDETAFEKAQGPFWRNVRNEGFAA